MVIPLEPKSSASANSATLANFKRGNIVSELGLVKRREKTDVFRFSKISWLEWHPDNLSNTGVYIN